MAKQPTLTPMEAFKRLLEDGGFTHDGFSYALDGCGTSQDWPAVFDESGYYMFVPSGDVMDPITENSTWLDMRVAGGEVVP